MFSYGIFLAFMDIIARDIVQEIFHSFTIFAQVC